MKERLKEENKGKRHKKLDTDPTMMPQGSVRSVLDTTRTSLVNILIGLVIGLLICFFLVVPTVKENISDTNTDTVLALNEALAESNSEKQGLNDQIESLKKELSAFDDKQDIATSYDNLFAAQNYLNAGDVATAAEYIQLVTKDVLADQGKQAYDTIYAQLAPSIIQGYYDDGNNFYTEENYDSAITNFKKVVEIDENYNDGAALFLLGDCYRLTDQSQEALECFNKVLELYPNNKWGRQAKVYIAADGSQLEATEVGD